MTSDSRRKTRSSRSLIAGWGRHLPDVLAWAANSADFGSDGKYLNPDDHRPNSTRVDRKWLEARRNDRRWQRVWAGGTDPLHLVSHAIFPVEEHHHASSFLLKGPDEAARATLVCDAYSGWYKALSECGLAQTLRGESWRVDVVVKPLGWLGTYRLSRATGVWFSEQHRWHELGW